MNRRIKRLFLVTIIFSLFLTFNSNIFALNNEFNVANVNVETTTSSINIKWGSISKLYNVFLDGEMYTETEENSININELDSNRPYIIKIQAIKNGKIIDNLVIETNTTMTDTEKNNIVYESEIATTTAIYTDNSAKIVFDNLPDEDKKFEVLRNNQDLVGNLNKNKNYIVDTNLTEETKYRYSIVGKVKLDKKEKSELKESIEKYNLEGKSDLGNIENVDEFVNQPLKEYELARTIETLSKEVSSNVASAAIGNWEENNPGIELIYTTFIPMGVFTFKPPYPFSNYTDYHKFHGDGRNFDEYALSDDYRTRTKVRVTFPPNKNAVLLFDKDVSATKGMNKKTKKWTTKKSSSKDVKILNKTLKKDSASFLLYHNVNNPLHNTAGVEAPGITYQYVGYVYRSGSFKIVGDHDQAPNHELTIDLVPGETHGQLVNGKFKVTYSTRANLFQHKIASFYYLFPGFPRKQINEQGNWK